MLRVRPYEEADAASCCAVINAAIADMDGLNGSARRFVIAKNVPDVLHAELEQLHVLVAEIDGVVAALGGLDENEIRRLYVHPEHQRRSAGDRLLLALETVAHERGIAVVRLDASPSSVAFYEHRGYTATRRQRTRIGDATFTVVPMHKRLAR